MEENYPNQEQLIAFIKYIKVNPYFNWGTGNKNCFHKFEKFTERHIFIDGKISQNMTAYNTLNEMDSTVWCIIESYGNVFHFEKLGPVKMSDWVKVLKIEPDIKIQKEEDYYKWLSGNRIVDKYYEKQKI